MNKTKFPEWRRYEKADGSGWTVMISRLEIDDWFKRVVEDFPEILTPEQHHSGNYMWVNPQNAVSWFEKWFSQFKEKDQGSEGSKTND